MDFFIPSKKDFLEAFRVFDNNKKGKISLVDFYIIMKDHGKLSDSEIDSILLDIF